MDPSEDGLTIAQRRAKREKENNDFTSGGTLDDLDNDLFDSSYNPETDDPTERAPHHAPKRVKNTSSSQAESSTAKEKKKSQQQSQQLLQQAAVPKVNILHTLTRGGGGSNRDLGGMLDPLGGGGGSGNIGLGLNTPVEDEEDRIRRLLGPDADNMANDDDDDSANLNLEDILFGKGGAKAITSNPKQEEEDIKPEPPGPPTTKKAVTILPQLPATTSTPSVPHVKTEVIATTTDPTVTVVKSSDRNFARTVANPKAGNTASNTVTPFKSEQSPPPKVKTESSSPQKLNTTTSLGGEKEWIDFYWIDSREISSAPGRVFLFGKVKSPAGEWKSISVVVEGLERNVFFLPKPECETRDLVGEIDALCKSQGIHRNRKYKEVQRWYAFEKEGVPTEKTTWLKLKYPADLPPLKLEGYVGRSFSHVFAANRSAMETLLMKRKIYGPCWLRVRGGTEVPRGRGITFCAYEIHTDMGVKSLEVVPDPEHYVTPPLVVASVNLVTHLNEKAKANEIMSISVVTMNAIDMDGSSNVTTTPKSLWNAVRKFDTSTPFPYQFENTFAEKMLPKPMQMDTERSLLECFLEFLSHEDPDVIVGHNFLSFHLDVLLHRFAATKIAHWSRIGRLQLSTMPKLQSGAGGLAESSFQEREVLAGRLCCDTYLVAKEYVKAASYSLAALSAQLSLAGLGLTASSNANADALLDTDDNTDEAALPLKAIYQSKDSLFTMIMGSAEKCVQAAGLAFVLDIIPLTKRMTGIAGNIWSRTLAGSRAERIEFLLLHKFHEMKFVTPDKKGFGEQQSLRQQMNQEQQGEGAEEPAAEGTGKKKAKYMGGMVLEPKRGLYTDYVMLLDFNSLYPSIIQEFNICFTTVDRPRGDHSGGTSTNNTTGPSVNLPKEESLICFACKKDGVTQQPCRHRNILPRVIRELVDSRRQVKQLMKSTNDEGKRAQLEIRQKALKLTANAMYGCLGFLHSRFYAQALAELITQQGRDALAHAVEMVPRFDPKLQVIYGDTDSVMINTGITNDLAAVRTVGNKIKEAINKSYKTLEIDIDGVFRTMLLVRKKKYAALRVVDFVDKGIKFQRDVKGLDVVRREWSPLSKRVSHFVLDTILSPDPQADALEKITQYIQRIGADMKSGQIPLEDYVITKSLTKEPETYQSVQDHPHVCVALRMKERMERVQVGDLIPYVMCTPESLRLDSSQTKLSYRARHPKEVLANSELIVDLGYYAAYQIYPPVSRLLEHIQGCNLEFIAEALGLDPKKFVTAHVQASSNDKAYDGQTSEAARVKYALLKHLAGPEVVYETAEHLLVPCVRATCKQGLIDILPHQYYSMLGERLIQAFAEGRAPDERMFKATSHPWMMCPSCELEVPFKMVYNKLLVQSRRAQGQYYKHGQGLSVRAEKENTNNNSSTSEGVSAPLHNETAVRQQFAYYAALFDLSGSIEGVVRQRILEAVQKYNVKTTELNQWLKKFDNSSNITEEQIATRMAKAVLGTIRTRQVQLDSEVQSKSLHQFEEMLKKAKNQSATVGGSVNHYLPDAQDCLYELYQLALGFKAAAVGESVALQDLFAGMGILCQ